ncbi:MAG: hypothetical protein WCG67_01000 [Ferruginibacter sp.]
MLKKILGICIITSLLVSCNGGGTKTPVTDTDVATAFIRAVLDNDFKKAQEFLLTDDTNLQYFETFQHQYQTKEKEELAKYKAADILINEIKPLNDSVHIVDYSNSYKRELKNKLKLIWVDGKWMVDLKFTFTEN